MNKPTYDWKWFEEHTPFKKTFEKYCDLTIDKESVRYTVFGYIRDTRPHFNIELSYRKVLENFDEIKNNLLNTRVCKNNREIFDYVSEKECTKMDISDLIIDGCLPSFDSASFSWNWVE